MDRKLLVADCDHSYACYGFFKYLANAGILIAAATLWNSPWFAGVIAGYIAKEMIEFGWLGQLNHVTKEVAQTPAPEKLPSRRSYDVEVKPTHYPLRQLSG